MDPACAIGLVLTGGTIAADDENSVLSVRRDGAREADLIQSVWPGAHVVAVASPIRELSENLQPQLWVVIAESIRDLVESAGAARILVLHGTDTMAYTAAALSFLLSDLDAPVVLTGANLPSGEAGSDAKQNVHDALVALSELERGVYVAFTGRPDCNNEGKVYLGTRLRKLRASGKAFVSVNRDLVGVVEGEQLNTVEPFTDSRPTRQFKQRIDDRVTSLKLHPGLDLDLLYEAFVNGDMHGVVLELYASATGPDTDDRYSVPRFVERCASSKIPVVTAIPSVPKSNGKTYETTLAIKEAGAIFVRDMLPETAAVKLMWVLGQYHDRESVDLSSVERLMLTPIAGELKPAEDH
jgi:L-asparaginase/Glu-tRNA(Gln) amidotransferase subunit D